MGIFDAIRIPKPFHRLPPLPPPEPEPDDEEVTRCSKCSCLMSLTPDERAELGRIEMMVGPGAIFCQTSCSRSSLVQKAGFA